MRWLPMFAAITLGVAAIPVMAAPAGSRIGTHRELTVSAATTVSLFKHGGRVQRPGTSASQTPSTHRTITASGLPLSLQSQSATTAARLVQSLAFPLVSMDQQVATFGTPERVQPPDTMMAAGPTTLLELVNRTASVWSKTGSLMGIVNLSAVLPLPTGWLFTDPRVLFDVPSGRFFFTGTGGDSANDSEVVLGVSKGSDPTGGFFVYQMAPTANGELHDQPKVGVSDDKVVIAWDDFMPGSVYVGSEAWVLQKSDVLTGASPHTVAIGPSRGFLSWVPVQSLSATATEYLVHDVGNFVSVTAITGTPAQNNVTESLTFVPMPAAIAPPPATQPGGGPLNTGDNRFLSAVWQNGILWTSGNVGCYQPGSSIQHACLRLVELSTVGAPSLVLSLNVSPTGLDVFYPAVTMDANGDLFVSFSASSQALYASAVIAELTAGPVAVGSASIFMQGTQAYTGFLWGDFSAVSIDPTTGDVWAAAEYAPTGSTFDWGTAAGLYTP